MSELSVYSKLKEQVLREWQTNLCTKLLVEADGNVTKAAKILGVNRSNLRRLLRQLKIKPSMFRKVVEHENVISQS